MTAMSYAHELQVDETALIIVVVIRCHLPFGSEDEIT